MRSTGQQFLILNMHPDRLPGLWKYIAGPILRISDLVDPRVEFPDPVETTLQEHCLGESEKGCLSVDPELNEGNAAQDL